MKAGAKLLNRMIVPARADEQAFFGLGQDGLLLYIQRLRTAGTAGEYFPSLYGIQGADGGGINGLLYFWRH